MRTVTLTKKKTLAGRTGGCGGVAKVSDFYFFQKNPSLKFLFYLFEGVKVREDWQV